MKIFFANIIQQKNEIMATHFNALAGLSCIFANFAYLILYACSCLIYVFKRIIIKQNDADHIFR